ncbi:MAG TPA: hypothetical protein VMW15_11015 [Terracidiphilus sp.]|nr:hypothetical protein [Terracidiphilus sp.]
MKAHEVLGLNPRPTPKERKLEDGAPLAARWLKAPAAELRKASLAIRLSREPIWNGADAEEVERQITRNEEGGIRLD